MAIRYFFHWPLEFGTYRASKFLMLCVWREVL